jgi:hypothetical protein
MRCVGGIARAVALGGAALALSGCGDDGSDPADERACGPGVEVRGHRLSSGVWTLERDLPDRVRQVTMEETCAGRPRVFESRGTIPATVALFPRFPYLAGRQRVRIYTADDTLEALRDHPLHTYIYGSPREPDLTSRRRCTRVSLRGVMVWAGAHDVVVRRNGREVQLDVEAKTIVNSSKADGVPRLRLGAPVSIQAVRCEGRARLVAQRLNFR